MGATVAVVSVVLAACAAVTAFELVDHGRGPGIAPATTPVPVPAAALAATRQPPAPSPTGAAHFAPVATPAGVTRALAPLVGAPGLGGRLSVDVIAVGTGQHLYSRAPTRPAAPASTAKLLTAAAALTVLHADDRITTRAVAGPDHSVVLVGAGDPTLSAARPGVATAYAGAARISDLAAQVRRAIGASGTVSRVVVDGALFTGPSILHAWAPGDVPSSYGAAITATMVDGGRADPSAVVRSATPDLDAGRALAAALGKPSLSVTRGRATAGAAVLGTVRSAPVAVLVEQMLQDSDNVIAEVLGRLVALAEHRPASFAGAVAAIRSVSIGLSIDPGAGMVDASGLAATDRLTARTLVTLMADIVDRTHPDLSPIAAALPVADWSGTLAYRYVAGSAASARGVVRAKTGTLTGVSTLAGYARDSSGQLLGFALMADRAGSTPAAEAALDRITARLSACGCS